MIRLIFVLFLSTFSFSYADNLIISETQETVPKKEEVAETIKDKPEPLKKEEKEVIPTKDDAPVKKVESDIFSIKTATLFIGIYQDGIKNYQVNNEGDRNVFSLAPSIGMNIALRLPNNLLLIPEFIYTYIPTEDSTIKKNLFNLRLDAAYDFNLSTLTLSNGKVKNFDLRLRVGTSLMIQTIGSEGGERTIQNGTEESTFFLPNKKSVSLNNTFDLGIDFTILSNFEIKLSSYTYQLFNGEKRSFSFGSYLGYRFEL